MTDLGQSQLGQSDLGQSQHMLVGTSLSDTAGQLGEGALHQHMESRNELQHQAQPTHALATGWLLKLIVYYDNTTFSVSYVVIICSGTF